MFGKERIYVGIEICGIDFVGGFLPICGKKESKG